MKATNKQEQCMWHDSHDEQEREREGMFCHKPTCASGAEGPLTEYVVSWVSQIDRPQFGDLSVKIWPQQSGVVQT